jgi:metallo-beta-lactamase class B
MRIIVTTIIFLLIHTYAFEQEKQPKLQISQLTGDFYIFTTFGTFKESLIPANGMFVITSVGAVMFDSPWDSTQLQPLLDSIKTRFKKEVIICIATHSHDDRTQGLEFLNQKGVMTFTTTETDDISKKRGGKRANHLMNKDTVFKVGGYCFQTFYGGKGHSPDNIVIWIESERILYGGCLIKSVEADDLGNLSDSDVTEWGSTIRKIKHKFPSPKFIIPGHQSWTSLNSLDHTLKLIREYLEDKNH